MKPDKTGRPLYTTSPDCNGLFTAFVWLGLVFFRATGKNQSSGVGSGKNQSEPDAEKQTYDRLVRPDFMYQTERKMSLVLIFGLCGGIAISPPRRALSQALGRYGHVVGLGRESLRQGKRGAHVGLEDATPHQSAARCGTMKGYHPIARNNSG